MTSAGQRKDLTLDESKDWWEDQVAHKGYFDGYPLSFEQPTLIDRLGLRRSSYILELGPGMGRETSQFCKISDHVYAVDISKTAVELVKKNAPAAHVSDYDGRKLAFEPRTFDLIYSCFVIQHMSRAQSRDLLRDCARVLKDDGRILFEFLDCARYNLGLDQNAYGVIEPTGEVTYQNGFIEPEIRQLVSEQGLGIDWLETVFHGPILGETDDIYNHWVCIHKLPKRTRRRPVVSDAIVHVATGLNRYVRDTFPGLHRALQRAAPLRAMYRRIRLFGG